MSETILEAVPTKVGTVLTEHEYNTLESMLSSKDKENHTMAQHILNQCDIKASIYWIWKLAYGRSGWHHASTMVYLRTKASREFRDSSSLFDIARKRPTDFAFWLITKKWMTTEIYQYLKPRILDELVARNKNDNFYDMHVTIKETYQELDPEQTLMKL